MLFGELGGYVGCREGLEKGQNFLISDLLASRLTNERTLFRIRGVDKRIRQRVYSNYELPLSFCLFGDVDT